MVTVEKTGCWVGCSVRVQLDRSAVLLPALYSSMNELVGLVLVPVRNSLILIWLTLRTCSLLVTRCRAWLAELVQLAWATRSPSNAAGPEVTVNVALTLARGATEANVFEESLVPSTTACHCRLGRAMDSFTLVAAVPVVLV